MSAAHRLSCGFLVLWSLACLLPFRAEAQVTLGGVGSAIERLEPILERVVELRGLEPREMIAAGIHSRATLRDFVIQALDKEVSPEQFRIEERVFRHLGILGPQQGYRELLVDLLTAQIAGFYDEDESELYLLDDLPGFSADPTLAHELFHGIQDQLFDLGTIHGGWEDADDALLAAAALIEGDAVAVMIDYTIGGAISFTDIPNFQELAIEQMGAVDPEASGMPAEVPPFVIDVLLFPYLSGIGFVHFLKSAGGWELVNESYLDPPISSEQVIHPERYVSRDHPTWIQLDLSEIEGSGYVRSYDQVFGECQWRALLHQTGGGELAERAVLAATDGWDGDRLVALESPADELVIIALSVWDGVQDAHEFASVFRRALELRSGIAITETDSGLYGESWSGTIGESEVVVERWGDMVLYLDGIPADIEGWRESVWRGRTRAGYPARSGAHIEESE